MLRWSVLLVLVVGLSKARAFQSHCSSQRQQRILKLEQRQTPLRQSQGKNVSPSLFTIFSNVREQSAEVEDDDKILSPPFMISRRSAASSIATTAASILFSAPAVALAEEEGAITPNGDISQIPTTTATIPQDPVFDAPVEKEKTIEYTVQDFTLALPANWKIITKYDGKSTKPSATPTLFSAIDFNSGAVLSVVREEACSVADYAKSSFEKSTAKKCDFALTGTDGGNALDLFSTGSYVKDASKLLIRHDDRDNAVLGAVSKINDSKLVGNGGLRRVPPEYLSLPKDDDSERIDSFSSHLLELSATTTIPTGGTYRDTMGLEQPNTIERKVLAKAVATTTKITTEILPPPSSEPPVQSTESNVVVPSIESEQVAGTTSDFTISQSAGDQDKRVAAASTPTTESIETGGPKALAESKEGTPSGIVTSPVVEGDKSTTPDAAVANVAKVTTPSPVTEVPGFDTSQSSDSIKTSMMAMIASIDEEINPVEAPAAESARNSLSDDEIQKAVEAAMEKAMASAIEAVKDNSIEPTIEAVTEKAKATAKEMALEMLASNKTSAKDESPPGMKVATASTPDAGATDLEGASREEPMSSISLAENPDVPAVPKTTSTMSTSVLSIWLSAPMDEWQKPAMGTRLNQIWDSVQYTSDIIEGTDDTSLLSQDDDDLARLLLMNKQAILR